MPPPPIPTASTAQSSLRIESIQAELGTAQRQIAQLEQQLNAANERAAGLVEKEKLHKVVLTHKEEELNKTKESLKGVEAELGRAKEALTAAVAERANSRQRHNANIAAERELRQKNATLEIELGKHKLVEMSRQIVFTTNKKRKRELEQERLGEEGRLDELADEVK